MSSKRVYWIEGDGIGPEIWRAARPVIDAALAKESDMRIEWMELLAGEKATAETGSPLPEETMNADVYKRQVDARTFFIVEGGPPHLCCRCP